MIIVTDCTTAIALDTVIGKYESYKIVILAQSLVVLRCFFYNYDGEAYETMYHRET